MNEFEFAFAKFQFRMGVSGRARIWKKLATLLRNGVPLRSGIDQMRQSRVALKGEKDPSAAALATWYKAINDGRSLSSTVVGWVDNDEAMLIRAGEMSGKLPGSLETLAEVMEAKQKIKSAVRTGTVYPAIILLIAIAVLVLFSYKVIPSFALVVPYNKWHGQSKFMVDMATFARDWIVLIVAFPFVGIAAFIVSLGRWNGPLRIVFDRYVPFSIFRVLQGSTWLIALSALVGAGMPVINAIHDLGQGASPWMHARLNACLKGMRSGLNVGEALAQAGHGFPDIEIIDDLVLYSKYSGFESALNILGREWIKTSVDKVNLIMKVAFGISVLCLGLFIAFMAGGLISMELQTSDIVKSSYQ